MAAAPHRPRLGEDSVVGLRERGGQSRDIVVELRYQLARRIQRRRKLAIGDVLTIGLENDGAAADDPGDVGRQLAERPRFLVRSPFTLPVGVTLEQPARCRKCGGRLEKLVSTSAIQFKGAGWYVTDYARKGSVAEKVEKELSSPESTSSEKPSSDKDKTKKSPPKKTEKA